MAVLAELGLPVQPLDVAALPAPAYELLYDWAIHRNEHLTKRQADAEAKKPKAGAPRAAPEAGA